MSRISWERYKEAIQESTAEVIQRKTPLTNAKGIAKEMLQKLAKEYKVDYKLLVRSLI